MKPTRSVLTTAFVLGAAFALGGPAAALVDQPIEVDVPFDFVVDSATLPAGTYIVEAADATQPGPLVIHDKDDAHEVVFDTEEADTRTPSTKSEVVFDEIDGTYYLCQIWQAGTDEGRALARGPEQRAIDRRRTRDHGHRVLGARGVERGKASG